MIWRKKDVVVAAIGNGVKQDDGNNSMFVMLMGWFCRQWQVSEIGTEGIDGKMLREEEKEKTQDPLAYANEHQP